MAFFHALGSGQRKKETTFLLTFLPSQLQLSRGVRPLEKRQETTESPVLGPPKRQFASTKSQSAASYKTMIPNEEVLNSWKEIAAYLGRGVRTVQRWEQELALPVRRPRGKSRSAVIAFKSELDKWLHQAPAEQLSQDQHEDQHEQAPRNGAAKPAQNFRFERHAALHRNTQLLLTRTQLIVSRSTDLCERLNSLRAKLERTVQLTSANVKRFPIPLGMSNQTEQKPAVADSSGQHHAVAS